MITIFVLGIILLILAAWISLGCTLGHHNENGADGILAIFLGLPLFAIGIILVLIYVTVRFSS